MNSKTAATLTALALGLVLTAGATAPAAAQSETPAMDAATLADTVETLAAKAAERGTVRVVIMARASRDAAGDCATAEDAGFCLAEKLAEDGAATSEQLPGTPYVTAELTAAQLRAAMDSGMIAAIQEDAPQQMQ